MNVAILSPIWPTAIKALQAHHACRLALASPTDSLPEVLRDADAAILRSGVRLDRKLLEAASRLRLIVRAGMGVDSIDCECARERGVRVVCVPLSAQSVAEHTLGLMLALSHQIVRCDAALRAGRWEKHTGHGRDLFGYHLGLLGFGRIGQRMAGLGRALGMSVSACDRSAEKPAKREAAARLGVRFVSLADLFSNADVVTIHTPLDETTRGLVDASLLATMKQDALLINVGRGGIVDEDSLYLALSYGRLGGAALDVFAREPPGAHALLSLPNFIGTPHVGAQTRDAQRQVGEAVVKILDAFAAGASWEAHGIVVV
jgi:D-3-phosphoglycerate dehydrogenase